MKLRYQPLLAAIFISAAALVAFWFSPRTSGAGKPKHVRLLHIADTHAQLDTHWEYLPEDPAHLHRMGGYARIRTALDQMRSSAAGSVFTVDGGDTFQGSAIAAWTQGDAIVAPFNALHIDVGTPGNWEVVYGPQIFRKLMHAVTERVVCYNFHDKTTGTRIFPPGVVLERDGVRVAFVGMTDPTTTVRQNPAFVVGLDTTRVEGLRQYVQKLKQSEKPDLTVLVNHTGLAPSVQIAQDIPEFDVILSGHTHERVYKPLFVGKTIVVEPGSMGSFIGELDLKIENGAVTHSDYHFVAVEESQFAANREVKALIDEKEAPFAKRLHQVVGQTTEPLMRYDVLESPMDNLIADVVRDTAHADVGFTNGFRFSPPLPAGPITEMDLWNMLPMDARMKVGKVTGAQMNAYLEHEMELVFSRDPFTLSGGWGPRPSGMKVIFQAKQSPGRRIKEVGINGAPLDPSRVYTIAGCERDGEPVDMICRLQGARDAHYLPEEIHAALRQFLRVHSPIGPVREGRVRATDLSDKVWSQYGTLQALWHLPGDPGAVAIPSGN